MNVVISTTPSTVLFDAFHFDAVHLTVLFRRRSSGYCRAVSDRTRDTAFLASYWWFILLSVVLLIWVRRAMRKGDQFANDELVARATRALDPTPTPWRAADVTARLAVLKRRGRPWLGSTLAVALAAAPFVVPTLVPALTSRAVLYIDAALAFLVLTIWRLRHDRVVQEAGLKCPACGAEQTAALLYKGQCEQCSTWLLHPNELDPWPASRITSGSPVRNAIGVIVLLSLMAWGIKQTSRLIRSNREDCARRYAAARTAADTSRLVSLGFCRSFRGR